MPVVTFYNNTSILVVAQMNKCYTMSLFYQKLRVREICVWKAIHSHMLFNHTRCVIILVDYWMCNNDF